MAYNPKSRENLRPFSRDYQPVSNGRKPSKLKKYIKDNGVCAQDVGLIVKNVIMAKTEGELRALVLNTKEPMMVRLFVKAFLHDFKKGTMDSMDKLLDRAIGKSLSIHEHSGPDGGPIDIELSPSDRAERIKELMAKRNADSD